MMFLLLLCCCCSPLGWVLVENIIAGDEIVFLLWFFCTLLILFHSAAVTCMFWMFKQSIKEPLPASIGGSPSAAAGDSHGSSSGMLQYLQSWFPGWGGWYGYAQQTYEGEPFEGLLPDPKEQWNPEDILGMETQGLLPWFDTWSRWAERALGLSWYRILCQLMYPGSTACLKLNSLGSVGVPGYLLVSKAIQGGHLLPLLLSFMAKSFGMSSVQVCVWGHVTGSNRNSPGLLGSL